MPDFIFIMVAHVYDEGVRVGCESVELLRIHITPFLLHVERRVINAVGNDLFLHFDIKHEERFATVIHGSVKPKGFEGFLPIQECTERLELRKRNTYLGIHPLGRDVDSSEDPEACELQIPVIPKCIGIRYRSVQVKRDGLSWRGIVFQTCLELPSGDPVVQNGHVGLFYPAKVTKREMMLTGMKGSVFFANSAGTFDMMLIRPCRASNLQVCGTAFLSGRSGF